LKLTKR